MERPGGDADGIASMEAEFLTVEPDVHIAIFDIRSLFPRVVVFFVRRKGLGRDLHQHKFDAAPGVRCKQVVGDLAVPVADGAVFPLADDELLFRVVFFLKQDVEREVQRLGQGLQGVDGRVDRIVLDLADHGSGNARFLGQAAEAQAPLVPISLDLLSDI